MTYRFLKTLCAFFVFSVLILTGCNTSEKQDNLVICTDFSSGFNAEYKAMKITGKLNCNSHKILNLEIQSPKTLSGLEFVYNCSQLNIVRDNMVCSADEAYIPEESFPNMLKEILFGISDGRAVMSDKTDNEIKYLLKTDFGNAILKANKEGQLVGVEIADSKLKLNFTNIKTD